MVGRIMSKPEKRKTPGKKKYKNREGVWFNIMLLPQHEKEEEDPDEEEILSYN